MSSNLMEAGNAVSGLEVQAREFCDYGLIGNPCVLVCHPHSLVIPLSLTFPVAISCSRLQYVGFEEFSKVISQNFCISAQTADIVTRVTFSSRCNMPIIFQREFGILHILNNHQGFFDLFE